MKNIENTNYHNHNLVVNKTMQAMVGQLILIQNKLRYNRSLTQTLTRQVFRYIPMNTITHILNITYQYSKHKQNPTNIGIRLHMRCHTLRKCIHIFRTIIWPNNLINMQPNLYMDNTMQWTTLLHLKKLLLNNKHKDK
jgi:hypothetical protein